MSSQYQVHMSLNTPSIRNAILGLSLLATCLLVTGPVVLASEATSDVDGAADPEFLKRFPHSHIVMYETTAEVESHTLVYGALKKINNVLIPKEAMVVDGTLTRITYRIPDGNRSSKVFKYFHSQLKWRETDFIN